MGAEKMDLMRRVYMLIAGFGEMREHEREFPKCVISVQQSGLYEQEKMHSKAILDGASECMRLSRKRLPNAREPPMQERRDGSPTKFGSFAYI